MKKMENLSQALPKGTVLRGKVYTYRIEKVLGQGAFGITYLASTSMHGPLGEITVPVAVKEFFAKDLDSRMADGTVTVRTEDGVAHRYARAFLRESENLSKMKHPGIVNVLESFEDKGTCYYSMEYLSGGTLDDKVKGSGIAEAEALSLMSKIGEALAYMHERKVMHLDLKPKNVMLKADGSPVIIDFGLSKQYDGNGEPESSTSIGLGTPGYASLEQANQTSGRTFQPTIDIYALGATLYKMLSGETPPNASEVLNKGFTEGTLLEKGISPSTVKAVRKAMSPITKDRPQSVAEFLSLISGEEDTTVDEPPTKPKPRPRAKPASSPTHPTAPPEKPKSKAWLWALLACAVVAAIITAIVGGRKEKPAAVETPAPVEIPAPVDKPTPAGKPTTGTINGHDWVDLGLPSGLKWATCNVGASTPSDYGSYFAWGETKPKSEYTWSTLRYCADGSGDSFTKYNTLEKYGTVDNRKKLEMSDDAARANWGGSWRMPTDAELTELKDKCTWTWTTQGGKNGYKVTSKKNGNSIFLPAAGYRSGGSLSNAGSNGGYWSSSLNTGYPGSAWSMSFDSDGAYRGYDYRFCGQSVRPVTE